MGVVSRGRRMDSRCWWGCSLDGLGPSAGLACAFAGIPIVESSTVKWCWWRMYNSSGRRCGGHSERHLSVDTSV